MLFFVELANIAASLPSKGGFLPPQPCYSFSISLHIPLFNLRTHYKLAYSKNPPLEGREALACYCIAMR